MRRRLAGLLAASLLLLAGCGEQTGGESSRQPAEPARVESPTEATDEPEVEEVEEETEPPTEALKQPDIEPEQAAARLVPDSQGQVPVAGADDLAALAVLVNSGDETHRDRVYVLQRNISAEGIDFIPIGSGDHPFAGTFEGGGFIVSGLTVRDNGHPDGAGLFGTVAAAGTVRNLHLTGGRIAGAAAVGGVVGALEGRLYNCSFNGEVTGSASVGGLVGLLRGESAVAESCFVNAQVTGSARVGGFAGQLEAGAAVRDSYCLGNVSAAKLDGSAPVGSIGGFAGRSEGAAIARCLANTEVYTYAEAKVVGGFLGLLEGELANCYYNRAATENWKAIGQLPAGSEPAAGAEQSETGETPSQAHPGLTACTVAELVERETYAGWDFATVWEIDGVHNRGLPFLRAAELY